MNEEYGYSDYVQGTRAAQKEALQAHQQQYVSCFQGCKSVLDLGCGEGFFLELLDRVGIAAKGLDRDIALVERARMEGKQVTAEDAIEHLKQHHGHYDGIHCSHFIEHLEFPSVVELIKLAAAALQEDGRLLLVFPNPESVRMQCFGFWKDPEHVRFYHADLVTSVCEKMGLRSKVLRPKPLDEPLLAPRLENSHRDWIMLEMEEPYRVFRKRMESLGLQEKAQTDPVHGRRSGSLFKILSLWERCLKRLTYTPAQARQDELHRVWQHLNALHDFTDASIRQICQWHEAQAETIENGNRTEEDIRTSFNLSLGRLIQTLNGIWGVPEEAAVLGIKSR